MDTKKVVWRVTTGTALGTALLCGGVLTTNGHAATWQANSPASIQIKKGQKVYTVREGDTLWAISVKTNIKVQTLAEASGITNPDLIQVGQKIILNGNEVVVEDANGTTIGKKQLSDSDRVVKSQPVGTKVAVIESQSSKGNKGTMAPSSIAQQPGTLGSVQQSSLPLPVANDTASPQVNPTVPVGDASSTMPTNGDEKNDLFGNANNRPPRK